MSRPAPFASYTAPAETTEIPMVPAIAPCAKEGSMEEPNVANDPANVPSTESTGVDSKVDEKDMLDAEEKKLQTLMALREAQYRLVSLKAMRGSPASSSPSLSPAGWPWWDRGFYISTCIVSKINTTKQQNSI